MDRDHELARNYGDISRGSREIEGDWYLVIEKGVESAQIIRVYNEAVLDAFKEYGDLYTVTPVEIFRKR